MIKYGDLQLIPMEHDYMIIACDSSGSIGDKPSDIVRIDPELAGYYTVIVPLIEVLATKGSILSVVDTLTVEMEPTGRRIINGINKALVEVEINPDTLTGSTEENMSSVATGIGVTVIGKISKEKIENKKVTKGMNVILVGLPKVGDEFVKDELIEKKGETLTLKWMKLFTKETLIVDMIPVGSKGIQYEADVLSIRHGMTIELIQSLDDNKVIDYNKSAGPATCLIMIVEEENVERICEKYKDIPITMIGNVVNRS